MGLGRVIGEIEGTYVLDFTQKATPLAPRVSVLNTIGEPVALRLSSWSAGVAARIAVAASSPSPAAGSGASARSTVCQRRKALARGSDS